MRNNFAFIDSQNVNLGIRELGWKLDFKRFRVYLKEKYHVTKAYLFIGYMLGNENMYRALQEYGYILIFKPILEDVGGRVKGNIDAELVLWTMIEYPNYNHAIVVSNDGDFYCLVEYLHNSKKLGFVLSPNARNCSILLKKVAREKIDFLNYQKNKLEYK